MLLALTLASSVSPLMLHVIRLLQRTIYQVVTRDLKWLLVIIIVVEK